MFGSIAGLLLVGIVAGAAMATGPDTGGATGADRSARPAHPENAERHRYVVERTFPAGALAGLDAATKAGVNARNSELGVAWITSYATDDLTRTYCVYEGPSEAAVRAAAERNALPVDRITEVPVDLDPGPLPPHATSSSVRRRYLVERTFPAGALDGLDAAGKAKVNATNAELDVRWVTSYANANRTKTFCVYEAPSETAVRRAAEKNGIPVDRITPIPVDLAPR